MIRARTVAASLALALAAAACGQKGDLKLPAAKQQAGTASTQPAQPLPPASTPAPASHK
jgi:predicted small lipoprotein YifL